MNRLKFWYCLLNLIPVMLGSVGCGSAPPPSIAQVSTATPSPAVPTTPTPLSEPATLVAVEAAPAPTLEIFVPTTVPDPQHGLTWTFYPLPSSYICDKALDTCYEDWPDTRDLVIDREDRVWTAHSDGVRVLTETGEKATWLLYTQAHGLPSDDVQALAVDQSGRVWAEARGNLAAFNGGAWTLVETLPGRSVSALTADSAGQIWASTGQEIVKFDGNLQVQEVIPFDEAQKSILSHLAVDQAGQVWVGSLGGGLSLFDGTKWTAYPAPDKMLWDYIKRLKVDPQGNLWLAFGTCSIDSSSCTSMGLSHFDDQSWSHYFQSTGHLNTAEDMVFDVALDSQGNTWVVTGGGVQKFDGQGWTTYLQNPDPGGYLIAIDRAGNKWIGSYKQIFKISP
jgi:ligand-binding sensor domain-containing protein